MQKICPNDPIQIHSFIADSKSAVPSVHVHQYFPCRSSGKGRGRGGVPPAHLHKTTILILCVSQLMALVLGRTEGPNGVHLVALTTKVFSTCLSRVVSFTQAVRLYGFCSLLHMKPARRWPGLELRTVEATTLPGTSGFNNEYLSF